MFNEKVTEYINGASEEQVVILEAIRDLIHAIEGVSEKMKWGFPVFFKSEDFAYLRFSREHISLVLHSYSISKGETDIMKKITWKKVEDFDPVEIAEWLKQI